MRCTALQMKRFVFKHFHKPACVVLEKIELIKLSRNDFFFHNFEMFVPVFFKPEFYKKRGFDS